IRAFVRHAPRAVDRPRATLLPGDRLAPVFTSSLRFRHVLRGSLAFVCLVLSCRILGPPFPARSPQGLLTTAAAGGWEPAPASRLRRAFRHLLCRKAAAR